MRGLLMLCCVRFPRYMADLPDPYYTHAAEVLRKVAGMPSMASIRRAKKRKLLVAKRRAEAKEKAKVRQYFCTPARTLHRHVGRRVTPVFPHRSGKRKLLRGLRPQPKQLWKGNSRKARRRRGGLHLRLHLHPSSHRPRPYPSSSMPVSRRCQKSQTPTTKKPRRRNLRRCFKTLWNVHCTSWRCLRVDTCVLDLTAVML